MLKNKKKKTPLPKKSCPIAHKLPCLVTWRQFLFHRVHPGTGLFARVLLSTTTTTLEILYKISTASCTFECDPEWGRVFFSKGKRCKTFAFHHQKPFCYSGSFFLPFPILSLFVPPCLKSWEMFHFASRIPLPRCAHHYVFVQRCKKFYCFLQKVKFQALLHHQIGKAERIQ